MINKRLWITLAVLVMAALACNLGKSNKPAIPTPNDSPSMSTEAPSNDDEPAATAETGSGNSYSDKTEFPLPENVSSFVKAGDIVNFQTTLGLKDALAFYKDALSKKGYKERSLLTVTTDTTFNLVFDGHASGKAIIVQGVDLGNGNVSISIQLQTLP